MRIARDLESGLTLDRLHHLLDYNPETGEFTRRVTAGGKPVGSRAGSLNDKGYVKLRIDGHVHAAHRLAWFISTGKWPRFEVDHVDGVRSDNRFSKLREADPTQQARNVRVYKNNTSGHKGVSWDKEYSKWAARIRINKRLTLIGRYGELADACEAYRLRASVEFGEFVRAA
jgi:hypothetical protein